MASKPIKCVDGYGRNGGEVIRSCRWARGLTQFELAEKSGVARQTISCAEIHRSGTSLAIFAELLNAMDYRLIVVDMKKSDGEQML